MQIVIISDFVPDYDLEDMAHEEEFLHQIHSQIAAYKIKSYFIEVQTLSELTKKLAPFDKTETIIFNWCEEITGIPNSAWLVTDFLVINGYIFTGADSKCLKLADDKLAVKKLLLQHKLPTPNFFVYNGDLPLGGMPAHNLRYPFIVKTVSEHGSAGLTSDAIVNDNISLEKRARYICNNYGGQALVEEFIQGPEYVAGVWGNSHPEVLPVLEIDFSKVESPFEKFQSHESKWDKSSFLYHNTPVVEPVNLCQEVVQIIKDTTAKAYTLVGCKGFARMEIRVQNNVPYIIDVNANPTFAATNSFLIAAQMQGYNFGEVVLRICEFALLDSLGNKS